MEETECSKKASSISSPPIKLDTNHANKGTDKASAINSHSVAKPGCSKSPDNEDQIIFIFDLITKRLTKIWSEIITMINKNEVQLVSLGDRTDTTDQ